MSKGKRGRQCSQALQRLINRRRVDIARIASKVDSGEIRRPNYVHEEDLTPQQREDISDALHNFLVSVRSGEVEYGSDIEVAYHNGFLLAAAWLIFSGTEADELREVFGRHRVDIHPDWWLEDGWGTFHDTYGVKCPECRGYSYSTPTCFEPENLARALWPETCSNCTAPLPTPHHTNVFAAGERFWAECSCGWEPMDSMGERSAKGVATRHVNAMARLAHVAS